MSRAYLLDTHVVIWALNDSGEMPPAYRDIMQGDDPKFVSAVCFWEIAIKKGLGRLHIADSYGRAILQSEVELLPISHAHAMHTERLPHLHGDPFDRMLVAQAQFEGLTILTTDRLVRAYDVAVV